MPDIQGKNPRRTALEQAVGEPAGRGPDVRADPAGDADPERVERRLDFIPAPAHEFFFSDHFQFCVRRDQGAGLCGGLPVEQDLGGHDGAARLLARVKKTSLDQSHIQPGLARTHAVLSVWRTQ